MGQDDTVTFGLTSWLPSVMFNCVFVTFPCGILGQVWYLIVLTPDLCHISYFYSHFRQFSVMLRRSVNFSHFY